MVEGVANPRVECRVVAHDVAVSERVYRICRPCRIGNLWKSDWRGLEKELTHAGPRERVSNLAWTARAGAYGHAVVQVGNENLARPSARPAPFVDRLDDRIEGVVVDGDFDANLLEQGYLLIDTAELVVLFGIRHRSQDVGAGQIREVRFLQGVLHGRKLLRLYYGDYELHDFAAILVRINR